MLSHRKLLLGVVVALAAPAPAFIPQLASANSSPSANWVQSSAQGPSSRSGVSLAYDSARGETVLFGGSGNADTWEFDGNVWTQRNVAGPPGRDLAPMVYDSARRVSVLFGGAANGFLQDTWEWDGSTWTRRFTANTPAARDWSAMAYDSKRKVAVLFGGFGTALLNDTWEYNGSDWTQVVTAHSPSARRGMTLAFDPVRGKTVLFGGQDSLRLNDTWEYDGSDWTQVSLSTAPLARLWHGMAYDAALGGIVVFGGDTPAGTASDTWIYDGASWQQISSTSVPPNRFWAPAVYDSGRSALVMFGGVPGIQAPPFGDTWSLVGTNTLPVNWSQSTTATAPAARVWPAMDYDSTRGVSVLFGGSTGGPGSFQDTWEWDGFTWTQRTPAISPPALVGAVMAFDSLRHVSVLFGGEDSTGALSSATWEWDGSTWTQRTLTSSPPARVWAAMAYDAVRGRMVMFGGSTSLGRAADTWEFDGNAWTQLSPLNAPSARFLPGMAFDSVRDRTVLFGGSDASGRMADTWTWDGSNWSQMPTAAAPYARFSPTMAFDSQRGKTVLFGGDHIQPFALGDTNDTWDWDGAQWTRDWTSAAPPIRAGHAMSFDSRRDRMVVFGGENAATSPATLYGDTWELGSGTVTPAGSPAATPTPASLEFGSVDIASSSTSHVYVVSSGTGPLETSISISGDFAIAPGTDCPNTPNPLAAGSSCFVFVTFAPTAAGDRAGSLTFSGNVTGGTLSVPLHGIGVAHDFTIAANPSSLTVQTGGASATATISTTVVGSGGSVALIAVPSDNNISTTLSPSTITVGTASTMTLSVAPIVAAGAYTVRVFGTEGAVSHYVDLTLQVVAPPDFTIAASPTSLRIAQGSLDRTDITTTAIGTPASLNLSASVTPAGPTAAFDQATIVAGGLSILTVSAGYGVAPGDYTVTITGVEGSFTHTTSVIVTVTIKTLVNGGFETGDLTGWATTGVVAVDRTTTSHGGSYTAQVGSVSASSDSTMSQTWTVPAAGGKLTFFFYMVCSDKVKNDWFTATISDGVTGAVSTVQAPVCTKPGWNKVTVNLASHAGHFVTVTFVNHDDGNPSDPTYTLIDDVSFT